jgi:hypothetical protein
MDPEGIVDCRICGKPTRGLGGGICDDCGAETVFYRCPVCGEETIYFECDSWDRGDPSTPYFESGYGPMFNQLCSCKVTQRQIDSFPIMDMCQPDDDW